MAWLLFLLEFGLVAGALILIVLVLLQKGKGGGLAGALGGMGGQSAFGTKAGDLFTRVTMAVAGVWIVLCVIAAMEAPNLAGNPLNITAAPAAVRRRIRGKPPRREAKSRRPAGPSRKRPAKPQHRTRRKSPATSPSRPASRLRSRRSSRRILFGTVWTENNRC